MKQNLVETFVGIFVIAVAVLFFMYGYKVSNKAAPDASYILHANFDNIDGITSGGDVKLSGIKIGFVESVTLEKENYLARAKIHIDKKYDIPKDSRISVSTSGIIGGKYLRIEPGYEEEMFKNNDEFTNTQSAINLEDLISKLVYNFTKK